MTVCTAAIAEKTILIGASDRMLTAGDIEFEPSQSKIWVFSSSIVGLIGGDYSVQAELLTRVNNIVQAWIRNDPKNWVRVRDVAELYCKTYRELRREWAEAEILYPLGLDLPSFLQQQAAMDKDQVAKIYEQLIEYDFTSFLEMIFIGKDHDGPERDDGQKLIYAHIYATERDKLANLTTVGFAAIGIGKLHAESQFMFSGHDPSKSFADTILLAYESKKRAEVAPGVGKDTDMVVIGPDLGTLLKVEDKHITELDAIHKRNRKYSSRGVLKAQQETKKFVDRVTLRE